MTTWGRDLTLLTRQGGVTLALALTLHLGERGGGGLDLPVAAVEGGPDPADDPPHVGGGGGDRADPPPTPLASSQPRLQPLPPPAPPGAAQRRPHRALTRAATCPTLPEVFGRIFADVRQRRTGPQFASLGAAAGPPAVSSDPLADLP